MEHTADPVESRPSPDGSGAPVAGKTPHQWKAFWQDELQAEHKRNREWRRQADQITKRYLDKRKDQGPQYNIGSAEFRVNLFHSNIFTLMAFLYGRVPTASVSRRFADPSDDVARTAANILGRMINTSVETDGGDFETILRGNLEDHLVPGLGVARVRYEVETETIEHEEVTAPNPLDPEEPPILISEAFSEERLVYEDAPVDYVHWRDFHWGWARMWKDVPWVGYDVFMTRDEATERFGPELASKLDYKNEQVPAEDENTDNPDIRNPFKTARVTEIWYKKNELVFWFHENCDYILDIRPDPLELDGFFPSPRPMVANPSTSLFQPTPYFMLAQDLYNEVDQLSTRINIITNAVKVVGAYDKSVQQLRQMLQGSIENDLVPVDNWAMMAEKGGLRGVIDFWPVEMVITTLDKLREMRREAIDLLYQVTGLSDILRGISQQYAGVGQEQLKAKFGGVRIQYLQEEFARFASDLCTLKAEIIGKHFEPQTILEQSNAAHSYDQRYIPQALQLIKNPGAIQWRVDIKPETLAMVDWAQLKADRTEYINALAIFLQSAAPLIQLQPAATPMLLELLKWGLAGFKGGQEIESVIDQAIQQVQQGMQQQQGRQEQSPEMQKAQLKLVENKQKLQNDLIKQMDKHNKELQKLAAQVQADLTKTQAEAQAFAFKEVVQADQNIREKRASAEYGSGS